MRKRRGISTKALVALLALVLVIGCSLGGTLAWLTDKDEVTNTFTVGDINIKLEETTGEEYKILPGTTIKKDPVVTVLKDSEDCWLFVKLTEENWCAKVTYQCANGWTELSTGSKIYYRMVTASTSNQPFSVLKDDTLTVSDTLTKAEINSIKTQPKLTITAYAVQLQKGDGKFTPADAWVIAQNNGNS